MGSMYLNIYVMGSRPLARLRGNTLVVGASLSVVCWAFYLLVPGWKTPGQLVLASLATFCTLVLHGLYGMAFEPGLKRSWEHALQRHSQRRFTVWLVIFRFALFWLLFLLLLKLFEGRGAPENAWFRWSYHLAVPCIGLRQILTRLFDDVPGRGMRFLIETVRLCSLYLTLSLLMSYLNTTFFPPDPEGLKQTSPGFYAFWTPAVLAAITGLVMYFDALTGGSERRRKG
jgi:hypothetical protein